jgi:hypothetical protein
MSTHRSSTQKDLRPARRKVSHPPKVEPEPQAGAGGRRRKALGHLRRQRLLLCISKVHGPSRPPRPRHPPLLRRRRRQSPEPPCRRCGASSVQAGYRTDRRTARAGSTCRGVSPLSLSIRPMVTISSAARRRAGSGRPEMEARAGSRALTPCQRWRQGQSPSIRGRRTWSMPAWVRAISMPGLVPACYARPTAGRPGPYTHLHHLLAPASTTACRSGQQ